MVAGGLGGSAVGGLVCSGDDGNGSDFLGFCCRRSIVFLRISVISESERTETRNKQS